MSDTKSFKCWLTFSQRGINRMTKGLPGLDRGEKAIMVNLTFPKSLFQEPNLIANIELVGEPPVEHTEQIVATVREALESIPHVHITVPVVNPPDDP